MSKILRRPMFRGGGQVSSYGKGIAAPLVPGYQMGGRIPGYQMGGNVSGGIVNLPGGYAKTANQRLLENINKDFGNASVGMSGMDTSSIGANVVANAANKFSNSVAPLGVVNLKDEDEENNGDIILQSDSLPPSKKEDLRTNADLTADLKSASDGLNYLDFTDEMLGINTETVDMKDVLIDVVVDGKIVKVKKSDTKLVPTNIDGSLGPVKRVLIESAKTSDVQDANKNMKSFPADAAEMGVDSELDSIINNPNVNEDNTLATTEVSAEDAMKENQELFKKLLGSKKARGQDISDMLLRFSGSQGNTVGEKFQNYTRAESAAGPGRGEKINQTAAALAINDYVAGKRSKEQGELLTKKIDYELDAKNKFLTPQEGDSNAEILRKIATAYKIEPGSNKAIKQLLKFRNPGKKIYGITADPTDKNIAKKLEIGLNIVTHKGAKTIIEKISETDIQVIPFSGI